MRQWLAAGAIATATAFVAAPSHAQDAPTPFVEQMAAKDVLSLDDLVMLAERAEVGEDGGMGVLAGKPFRAVVRPDQTTAEGPRWWYDKTQQALGLHAPIGRLSGNFFSRPGCIGGATARGVEVAKAESKRRLIGQTPDGERQLYDQRRQYRVSLGGLECDAPAAPSGLNTSLAESRRKANEQIPTLQAIIEGRLQPADGAAMVVCAGQKTTATTETPTELVIHQCVVGAAIQRITFTADGGELASWTAGEDRGATRLHGGNMR